MHIDLNHLMSYGTALFCNFVSPRKKNIILYLCLLVFHFVEIFDSHNIIRNIIIYIDESTLMKFRTKLPSTSGQMHQIKVPLWHCPMQTESILRGKLSNLAASSYILYMTQNKRKGGRGEREIRLDQIIKEKIVTNLHRVWCWKSRSCIYEDIYNDMN